jgi:hypothetical protein
MRRFSMPSSATALQGPVDEPRVLARGVVFVLACPRAVSPHLEWALSAVFGEPVRIDWAVQVVAPTSVRAQLTWEGPVGTGARIASALLPFAQVRYEVTEDPTPGRLGERFSATPALGLFRADIGPHGDVLIPEDRLKAAVAHAAYAGTCLEEELGRLIGQPWDEELEAFRGAFEESTVRVLDQVI